MTLILFSHGLKPILLKKEEIDLILLPNFDHNIKEIGINSMLCMDTFTVRWTSMAYCKKTVKKTI